jgi:hypothetical protein
MSANFLSLDPAPYPEETYCIQELVADWYGSFWIGHLKHGETSAFLIEFEYP